MPDLAKCVLVALAVTVATALAAAPATAQAPEPVLGGPASEAADQTLGMALMSAYVTSAGGLVEDWGGGAVSASRADTGIYDVIFARSIVGCPAAVTVVTSSRTASIFGIAGDGAGYRVLTRDTAGTLANSQFFITVICPR